MTEEKVDTRAGRRGRLAEVDLDGGGTRAAAPLVEGLKRLGVVP